MQEKNRESYNSLVYNEFFNIRIDAGFEGNIKLNYTEKIYWLGLLKLLVKYYFITLKQQFLTKYKYLRNKIFWMNNFVLISDWKNSTHINIHGRYFHVLLLKVTVEYAETFLYTMILNPSVNIR